MKKFITVFYPDCKTIGELKIALSCYEEGLPLSPTIRVCIVNKKDSPFKVKLLSVKKKWKVANG